MVQEVFKVGVCPVVKGLRDDAHCLCFLFEFYVERDVLLIVNAGSDYVFDYWDLTIDLLQFNSKMALD